MASRQRPHDPIGTGAHRLPVGWCDMQSDTLKAPGELIDADPEGHALTVAKTGGGKSRGCSIPALLSCRGSMVVLDIKGELYNVTQRRRRELGQRVVRLDPWRVCGNGGDSFNPFDILSLPGLSLEDECLSMAENIQGRASFSKDPFWDECAKSLLAGLIAFAATENNAVYPRALSTLRALFTDTRFEQLLAQALDGGNIQSELARAEFVAFLSHADNSTRPSVKSTAQSLVRQFATPDVCAATDNSSFALRDFIDGEPMTIYLVVPIDKVHSHGAVLRLWLNALMRALTHRSHPPPERTVFLIDEAGSVGHLESLSNATVFMRSYGVQVWTFWQSFSQIKQHYGADWRTIVDNAATLQVFSAANYAVAAEFAALLGEYSADDILALPKDRALVRRDPAEGVLDVRRVDYINDPIFRGQFDPNPFHRTAIETPPSQDALPDNVLPFRLTPERDEPTPEPEPV